MSDSAPPQVGDPGVGEPRLVLASASPRRRDLLAQIGLVPGRIIAADLDERPHAGELPRPYAQRLAREKAAHVAATLDEPALVLGADTVVALGRRILPKAEDRATAQQCLSLLSGRRHTVLTAVALRPTASWTAGRPAERVVFSTVAFSRLTDRQIDALLDAGDWDGKAGGYAVQGHAAAFIRFLSGSPSAVIGLPLFEVAQMLRGQKGDWIR
ncbi:Maf family protein [Gluconacetobacter diazotrophicus]|uniref:dTTP/UTP pyrophosphatase n=2 Tax=Gluconacetobacter diazotrophicus TaxID=33996 RepID=A9HFL9_GLUDA|nr:Maf family protein [Gluconacetobacter diazotrophicus]MBB2155550.1 septum formation protein Maf [Gluconacetobacter diazotrophicus]CAP55381.1 Inhibitor of septum formation, Maf-like protein [Gluconacetobacter diazotrophicus PA1 5]